MKDRYDQEARKRPVNLTLNEELVVQARELTTNLSGVVESLLTDFVENERRKRVAKTNATKATIATWNEFNEKFGSFADEYSTL
jgi:antitoxin CcdA